MTFDPPGGVLAVDFGTSNSAAAVFEDGAVRPLPIEGDAPTLPTAVFFPKAKRGMAAPDMLIGEAAVMALRDGREGRFMRALKSVLGTDLAHEPRMLGGRRTTLIEVIVAFLTVLRERAEARAGRRFTSVLSGRPVRFHSDDMAADARAEADLHRCYEGAGFERVAFMTEPEAAAIAYGAGEGGDIGLIVDIGGGTSDFSVYRAGQDHPDVLATNGVRLGGTDFDRSLSLARVMPELGLGGSLRRTMGTGLLPVPAAPYVELSTWVRIPFLYADRTRAMVDEMARVAVEPERIGRLAEVLEMELGHDIAFAVERGKIAANDDGEGRVDLGMVERGLAVPLDRAEMDAVLIDARTRLQRAAAETLRMARVAPGDIDRVVLVGGSSLMGFVGEAMSALCPTATMVRARAFTAVVDGLAIATRLATARTAAPA